MVGAVRAYGLERSYARQFRARARECGLRQGCVALVPATVLLSSTTSPFIKIYLG